MEIQIGDLVQIKNTWYHNGLLGIVKKTYKKPKLPLMIVVKLLNPNDTNTFINKTVLHLNIENIFFNGYLMTPAEMIDFVDSFSSKHVQVHFDTGNIMLFQFPEHWIQQLGGRIRNVHLKEFTKKGTDHSLESFRPLLDGTTNWPAVIQAFEDTGYNGYLTFEYFHPYTHYPEALIHQTSDSLDRMLGRLA